MGVEHEQVNARVVRSQQETHFPTRLNNVERTSQVRVAHNTHKPVTAADDRVIGVVALTKDEHVQFAFLNHDENVHPALVLGPPPSRLPVLLAA